MATRFVVDIPAPYQRGGPPAYEVEANSAEEARAQVAQHLQVPAAVITSVRVEPRLFDGLSGGSRVRPNRGGTPLTDANRRQAPGTPAGLGEEVSSTADFAQRPVISGPTAPNFPDLDPEVLPPGVAGINAPTFDSLSDDGKKKSGSGGTINQDLLNLVNSETFNLLEPFEAAFLASILDLGSQGVDVADAFNGLFESITDKFNIETGDADSLDVVLSAAANLAIAQIGSRTGQMQVMAQILDSLQTNKTQLKIAELNNSTAAEVARIQTESAERVAQLNGTTAEVVAQIGATSAEKIAALTGESAETVASIRGQFDLDVATQTGVDQRAIAEIQARAAVEVAKIQANPFNFTQEQQIEIERLRATGGLSPDQLLEQERIRAGASLIPVLANLRSNPAALGSLVATGGLGGLESAISGLSGQPQLLQDIANSPSGNVPASVLNLGPSQTPQFQSLGGFQGAPQNLSAFDIRDFSDENLQFLGGQAASSGITPSGLSQRIASNTPAGL